MAKKTTKTKARLRIAKVPLVIVQPDKLKPALKPIVEPVVVKLDRHEALLIDMKAAIKTLEAQVKRLARRSRS